MLQEFVESQSMDFYSTGIVKLHIIGKNVLTVMVSTFTKMCSSLVRMI